MAPKLVGRQKPAKFFKKCRKPQWQCSIVGGLPVDGEVAPSDWSNLDRLRATCEEDHIEWRGGTDRWKPWRDLVWRSELGPVQSQRLETENWANFNFVLKDSGLWPFRRLSMATATLGPVPWPWSLWIKGVWANTNTTCGAFYRCGLHLIVRRVSVLGLQIDVTDTDIFHDGHGEWSVLIRLLNLNGGLVAMIAVSVVATWGDFIVAFQRQCQVQASDMCWFRFTTLQGPSNEYFSKVLHWEEGADCNFSFPAEETPMVTTVNCARFQELYNGMFDQSTNEVSSEAESMVWQIPCD